jgi:hypothetical protein
LSNAVRPLYPPVNGPDSICHVGGSPSVVERLLIGRVCRIWINSNC